MKSWMLLLMLIFSISLEVYGSTKFDYPELVVTPSASERLLIMAKKEKDRKFYAPLSMQLPALTTFAAGIMTSGELKDPNDDPSVVGMIIGGGLLAFNYFQFNRRDYYSETYSSIKKMPAKTTQQRLTRERLAEEALRDRASFVKKMKWISMVGNLTAGVLMSSATNKDTLALTMNYISAGMSLLPLVFGSDEEAAWDTHKSYKKKIYAPLVQTKLFYDKNTKKYIPGMNVSYSF